MGCNQSLPKYPRLGYTFQDGVVERESLAFSDQLRKNIEGIIIFHVLYLQMHDKYFEYYK